MQDLLNKQECTSGLISRTIINLKKLGRDNITRGAIRARLEQLETYWNKLQENHYSLIGLNNPTFQDTSYYKERHFDKAADDYATVKGELLDMLYEFENTTPNANSTNTEDGSIAATGGHHNMLPRINVPRFSGNYTDWASFNDLFTSLVHNNTSLSDVQRLHYLKLSLTGEAEQLLKNLEVTSANYKIAWDQLVARYENKRLIIHTHLQNLTKLPAVQSESASELKRLYDGTTEVIRALENLKRPVDYWDDWLVHITVDRLDIASRRDWEKSISSTADPVKYTQLKEFIEGRIRELEALDASTTTRGKTAIPKETQSSRCRTHAATTTPDEQKCQDCSGKHFIMFCSNFRKKTPDQRRELIFQKQLCYNCLSNKHLRRNCASVKRCQNCGANHHSMLHGSSIASTFTQSKTEGSTEQASTSAMTSRIESNSQNTAVLLATAKVNLRSADGRILTVRALLDQGSESSFITESVAQQLRLKRKPTNITVYGLGNATSGTVRTVAFVRMHSQIAPDKSYEVRALVMPKLTTLLPTIRCLNKTWTHLEDLQLADPDYNKPARIDLVLGADIYSQILLDGVRTGLRNSPVAQRTTLGWILSGVVPTNRSPSTTCSLHCVTNTELSIQLQRFWQVEDVATVSAQLTDDEIKCETHFTTTHTRDDQGRYVVRLPFKTDPTHFVLKDSYQPALQLLLHMERRFMKNPDLANSYTDFMTEYSSLGHMAPISRVTTTENISGFILPHHSVTKTASSTTKLRVVFNASQPSLNGLSLNDALLIGPKLQPDLSAIILRWRMHPIVFGADIAKMYRQIWVHPEDCDYQRILWRAASTQPVQQYRLLTVTYGTASAPFLALRVLRQLAHDEQNQYPLGAKIILRDMYIDDVLTGANSIPEAVEYQRQLTGILKAGGFHLRKWVSNSSTLLEEIPHNEKEPLVEMELKPEAGGVPVLGLFWQPQLDTFKFRVQLFDESFKSTKRGILSDIARLFDPLGWLSPVTITAKILLQSLWLLGVDWDTNLPTDVEKQWKLYRSQLHAIERISLRRWTGIQATNQTTYELHGFADASERAYAAVIYLRVQTDNDNVQITLLSAKTKVAPVKRVSLPRLELCAATLLARLTQSVQQTLDNSVQSTYLWTDSTVVLAWIKGHASRWKTFIANRVSEIQTLQSTTTWHHVSSSENPADCASRGLYPVELENHSLWWNGPQWLTKPSSCWPTTLPNLPSNEDLEDRVIKSHATLLFPKENLDLLLRYSSLNKLIRVTGYCKRFIFNLKHPVALQSKGHLTPTELREARHFWIMYVQKESFAADYKALQSKESLTYTSHLSKLKPFLDESGLLRVGGRLQHSLLNYDEKHPIILPKQSPFTTLVIHQAHQKTLHGGTQLTLSYLRRIYWILGGRQRVRSIIRQCRNCLPYQATSTAPLMANLPAQRVQPSRPFLHSGVDYAGPIRLRTTKGRGFRAYKGYIAVFVCMATRAIHLEVVSDYTTSAFIAAYKRFVSRRGVCSTLWSDNGTTFVGADNELKRLFQISSPQRREIAELLSNDGTDWKFIPPASPHFGGLWEAGVRSTKHHLRRVIGEHTLTYEELATFLAEVEACLNSRPLQALSDDPTDLTALTPGHFLIGSALTTIPEPSLLDIKTSRLNRWQLLRQMYEHFWVRWSSEYLTTLQARHKWRVTKKEIKLDDLALLIDERLPPSKWALCRVTALHPGSDNEIRVVTIRSAGATLTRPVTKLCFLPRHTEDN